MAKTLQAVTHTITPADEDGQGLVQIRVLVRTATMLDLAREQNMQADAWDWLQDAAGITPATFEESEIDPDTAAVFAIAHDTRARLMSVVERWEMRNGSGEWETVAMPADWESIEDFARNVPQAFVLLWRRAANNANPNLWVVGTTPAEKKRGSVTVTELTTN